MEQKHPKNRIAKPAWVRTDSWKFHAIVISVLIVFSTFVLFVGSSYDFIPMELQMGANVALNWTALAYAIYIYKIYDKSKEEAVKKLKEHGVEVVSLEEGVSAVLTNFKKITDWTDENAETMNELKQRLSKVKIKKILDMTDQISDMWQQAQEKGYTPEKFAKLLDTLMEIDLDRIIKLIEAWNETKKNDKDWFERAPSPKEDTRKATPSFKTLPMMKGSLMSSGKNGK